MTIIEAIAIEMPAPTHGGGWPITRYHLESFKRRPRLCVGGCSVMRCGMACLSTEAKPHTPRAATHRATPQEGLGHVFKHRIFVSLRLLSWRLEGKP